MFGKRGRGDDRLLIGLVLNCIVLLFLLFPNLLWTVISVADARNWTWRTYAAGSAIAIVVLLVAKVRQERRWQNR